MSVAELSIRAARNGDSIAYEVFSNSTATAYVFIFENSTQVFSDSFIGYKAGRISASRLSAVEIRAAVIGGEAKSLAIPPAEQPAANTGNTAQSGEAGQAAKQAEQPLVSDPLFIGLTLLAIAALAYLFWDFTKKAKKKGGRT